MRVVWSPMAMASLNGILDHLEQLNPEAARRVGREMFASAAALGSLPRRHRDRGNGIRVMPVLGTAFLLHYRVENAVVRILLVRHGRQVGD